MNLSGISSRKMKALIIFRALRNKLKGAKPTYNPFVYKNLNDMPHIDDDTWNSPLWIYHVKNNLQCIHQEQSVHLNIHQSGLVDAIFLENKKSEEISLSKTVNICDLGGGVGLYYPIVKRIANSVGIEIKYAVVDGLENCSIGSEFFGLQDGIGFFDFENEGLKGSQEFLGKTDVVNISGTLHYIPSWETVLESASELKPSFICISRHPTPDHSEECGYVIQHVTSPLGYCGDVKVVLIPRSKLIEYMGNLGYALLLESGGSGDGNWYWASGCSDANYFQITNRQFLFVSKNVQVSAK